MTPRTRKQAVRGVVTAGILAIAMALSGCMGAVHDSQDMVAESERVLAIAEDVIPAIADQLNMTIVETQSTPFTGGGMEGAAQTLSFQVQGELAGDLPTQKALEDAVATAGLKQQTGSQNSPSWEPGTDEAPMVRAETEDGSVHVSLQLITGRLPDGFRFSVVNSGTFKISDEAKSEYFWDLVPQFDPSLVEPLAGAQEMAALSNRTVAEAEQLLGDISRSLGHTIAAAEVMPQVTPDARDGSHTFSVAVAGDLIGERPTQQDLEDALTAAGLVAAADQSEYFANPGSDERPAFAANGANGALQLRVWEAPAGDPRPLYFSLETAPQSGFSDTAWDEYFPDLVPEFDPS